ncbi:MAG: 1,4-alpha-glucan branching protein GlgB [Acidobacteriota bacterium]
MYSLLLGHEKHRLSLADQDHENPHAYLGPRAVHVGGESGVIVRAKQPRASSAWLVLNDGEVEMTPLGHDLFAAYVPGRDAELTYQLRFSFDRGAAAGTRWQREDPYRFSPTLTDEELYFLGEGTHRRLWQSLGCTPAESDGVTGRRFAVWAPNARSVAVVGSWNGWDPGVHPMRRLGTSGTWEIFIPGVEDRHLYKFDIKGADGKSRLKADPLARWAEVSPGRASRIFDSDYSWGDDGWMVAAIERDVRREPMAIYEVHLGSWAAGGGKKLSYRDLAEPLVESVKSLGFNYIELMPVAEHPYDGSWGYQVTGYYAPTSRFGTPDDFRYFVDYCHQHGVGVILDWVPAHFVKDAHGLGRFDGSALYEHHDPRRGEHPDWGTYIFNYGRFEVRNFLVANALYWLDEFHIDGLRVDAVASMLYLDYSRKEGEWLPNAQGGHENFEAIALLREVNRLVREHYPGRFVVAEESTAWPGVTERPGEGGLGFNLKWNMGWMHDTLEYFSIDPLFRSHHHDRLVFSMVYEYSEAFVNPLSHDEVVHGKGSLLTKMSGDPWRKRANLRCLYTYLFTRPGKVLLFMGGELGSPREWNHELGLDRFLEKDPDHRGIRDLVAALGALYCRTPCLWRLDHEPDGFEWVSSHDRGRSVFAYVRYGEPAGDGGSSKEAAGRDHRLVVLNLTPVPREGYRLGVPAEGTYRVLLNSDEKRFGGSAFPLAEGFVTEAADTDGFGNSLVLTLPPLSALVLGPA